MPTLRIRHSRTADGSGLVAVDYDPARGSAGFSTAVPFVFELSEKDRGRLRFYMEDFLSYPDEPARNIAARIEEDVKRWGEEMFRQLFPPGSKAQRYYWEAAKDLGGLRIEIQAEHPDAWAAPWEILRDPELGWLAVQARSFVRLNTSPRREYEPPEASTGPVRILYAICRPEGRADVPFQSIARPLLDAFAEHRDRVRIDILRPPTFDQLGRVLRDAADAGRPYHVLHFDGHGVFTERPEDFGGEANPRFFRYGSGGRGYLLFEDPARPDNRRLVSGTELGDLLVRARTPLVFLNACQSATARLEEEAEVDKDVSGSSGETSDPDRQDRAYGSLAHEIMDAGAGSVVGMQWTVYVETAARFVGGFYERIARGDTVGEAASAARADLERQPRRSTSLGHVDMDDWAVPVVYEAATLPLFERRTGALDLDFGKPAPPEDVGGNLPRPPVYGFVDRGELTLALDRALDQHSTVLLHAYAGAGKTAMAREFALWYLQTGGLDLRRYDPTVPEDPTQPQRGVVLWSSFEAYKPVTPFDAFGDVFGPILERQGVAWGALTEREDKKGIVLQVLRQVPVLWVWDNVEPVSGFPAGTESAWSKEEQDFLRDLLHDLEGTRCKVLLTSRRKEEGWLGDLPYRVPVPPMPMDQRIELAERIAARQQHSLKDLADLRPLLKFSQGNPLTITVLVGQALKKGYKTKEGIEKFVEELRSGEAEFEDEESEGRSRSLGVALRYGFQDAFTTREHRLLALLHLFQGHVDAGTLLVMGGAEYDWSLPETRDLTREQVIDLLDRASDLGLLDPLGDGCYAIHPALPWFFRDSFERIHKASILLIERAFVEAMGEISLYYSNLFSSGLNHIIHYIRAEEENFLNAHALAKKYHWWRPSVRILNSLSLLYSYSERQAEWKLLIEAIAEALPQRVEGALDSDAEFFWSIIFYKVLIAQKENNWGEAYRLQRLALRWHRRRAAPLLSIPVEDLTEAQKNIIESLIVALETQATNQRALLKKQCVRTYKEALRIARRIGDQEKARICAFNLGHAYSSQIPGLHDLDRAEKWYLYCLALLPEYDHFTISKCLGELGFLSKARFEKALAEGRPEEEIRGYLENAVSFYLKDLELLPADAIGELQCVHNQLGNLFVHVDFDLSRLHYRQAIRLAEEAGDLLAASKTRYNLAMHLVQWQHVEESLEYAQAAFEGFKSIGEVYEARETQRLVRGLKKLRSLLEADLQPGD